MIVVPDLINPAILPPPQDYRSIRKWQEKIGERIGVCFA